MLEGQMEWTRDLRNICYPSLRTPERHLNPRKSFLKTDHWIQIYSNQKDINYISPSKIRVSAETRPPKSYTIYSSSLPTSIPDILWASPPTPPPPPRFARFNDTRISEGLNGVTSITLYFSAL